VSSETVVTLLGRIKAKREPGEARDASSSARYAAHGRIMVPAVSEMRELGLSTGEIAETLRLVADLLHENKSIEQDIPLLDRLNAQDDRRQSKTNPT
jgi:hypothetical protein